MTAPDVYRLSKTQRRAWLSAAGAGPRLLTVRARVSGLAEADLGPAVAAVTARHEATRLRFVQHADLRTPVQTVDDEYQAPGAAVVFALAGDDLVISGSALVVDPASLVVLLVDLARAVDGTLVEEPEPLQLLDVSEWQHEQLDQVAPPPVATLTPLALPFPPAGATSDPGASASGSGELRVRLAGEAARRLVEAAAVLPGLDPAGPGSEPAGERTVETLVVAAWAQALSRYRDDADDDLVLAWYGGGRSVDGTDQVVGPLGHYGPLRVSGAMEPRVSGAAADPGAFVAGVREALNAAGARQHLVEPLDSANVALDAGGVAFLTGVEVSAVKALGATAVTLDRPEPVGGLHLGAELTTDRLDLTLRYDRSRYADDSARRLLDAVAAILGSLPDALSGAGELRLLGAEETELLDRWSGPDQPAGDERTLLDVLNGGVRGADGTATAVVAADGTLTFADLDRAAGGLARHLRARGVAAGERVVVVGERSWRTIVAFLGVLRAGAVYVPVDPDGPPARIVRLARAVDAALVVGPPARRDLLDGLAGDLPVAALDDEVLRTDDEVLAADVDDRAGRSIGPGDAAYVIFTSGSTGAPHPVVVEHGSAASLFDALCATIYADRRDRLRVAVNAPFVFDASIKQMIQLGAGHTLYLVPAAVRADGSELLRYLTGQRIDVFDGTPSHLRALLGAWPSASAGSTGPPASTGSAAAHPGLLLVGGEPIDARLWSELAALPRVHAINLYGPTECTVDATAARIDATSEPSIGRPLPGVRVSILDGAGRPVPAGAPGELYLTGRQVARGYLGDADTTGRRFAGRGDGRRYRTGDRARFAADGRLEYLGRRDDQLKIRGFRVEPAEIEAALLEHPGVARAAVVAQDGRLVGYVVPSAGGRPLDPDRLAGVNPHETRYLYDEIFVRRTYLRGGVTLREDAVVLDVGANIGMFCLFARALAPRGEIYAFEPLAPIVDVLRRNLADHAVPARVFDHGLSDAERETSFTYYPGYSMMSGQREYADAAAEIEVIRRYLGNERDQGSGDGGALLEHIDELLDGRFRDSELHARLRRLSDVLDEQHIDHVDLLKIDVQRAELDVLHGLDDRHWPLIGQIAMEVHDGIGSATHGRIDTIVALLEERGFDVVVEQEAALAGTDRFALYAVRPEYEGDSREHPSADPADEATLRAWLADRLPSFLVPDAVVALDDLPSTANGKLDRAALPAPPVPTAGQPGTAPENRAEEILVEVWREVLHAPRIGVEDNFFSCGGDSIRSIQAQVGAARRGLVFPLPEIFAHQTIRELVRHGRLELAGTGATATARGTAGSGARPSSGGDPASGGDERSDHGGAPASATAARPFALLSPADRDRLPDGVNDAYPMSTLQQGMVFHTEITGDAATYHNVTTHLLDAPLDEGALRESLAGLIATHPILRTAFDLGGYREPLQLVHRTALAPLWTADLRDLPDPDQVAALAAAVRSELGRAFDWSAPPLVRFAAVSTADDQFWLLVSEHHAILDGWSLHLLLAELRDRYGRLLSGRHADPTGTDGPEILPYRRYVELERAARADHSARTFWRRRTAEARPLIVAGPPAGTAGHQPPRITARWDVELPGGLGPALARAAEAAGVPLKSLLLAVHVRALGELAGRDDVVSGLVASGRPGEPGGDRTLGLFLNVLPLRVDLGTESLSDLGRRVWRVERAMMGRHLTPLADIQQAAGRGPLFDVFFNYTRFHEVDEYTRLHDVDEPDAGVGMGVPVLASRGIPVDVAYALAVDAQVAPAGGALALYFQYDEQRLDGSRLAVLGDRFRELLGMVAAGDDQLLPALPGGSGGTGELWPARVSELWGDLLGTAPRDGGADFFADGGTSLLALRMVAVLRARYGVTVALPDFTGTPTFASLVGLCKAQP